MLQIVYFTLAALLLYVGADWLLNKIEARRGRLFKHRQIIFFAIILVMSVSVFELIQRLMDGAGTAPAQDVTVQSAPTQDAQSQTEVPPQIPE